MMPEAARDGAAATAGCGELQQRMAALLDRCEALEASIRDDRDRPGLGRQVTLWTAALRETRDWMDGHVLADVLAAAIEARGEARGYERGLAAAARVPGQRKARHAAEQRPLWPRLAGSAESPAALAPLAGGWAVLRSLLGHHAAAKALAGAGALGIGVSVVTAAPSALAPYTSPWAAVPHHIAAPAAAPFSAVRIPQLPADTDPPSVAAVRARPARPRPGPPGFPLPPPAPPTPPSPAPPSASPGVLDVTQAAVILRQTTPGTYTGQLVLYATGGPVSWSVDWLGTSAVLAFDTPSGILPAGTPFAVTVSVSADQVTPGASWTVTLQPGGQPVTVTAAR